MNFKEELKSLLIANIPMINLVTYEEERMIKCITEIADNKGIYTWDIADGFTCIRESTPQFRLKELTTDTLLPYLVSEMPDSCIIVLKDFHHSWIQKKSYITRKLRNMRPALSAKDQHLIFITPSAGVPEELKDDVLVMEVPLPDTLELNALFTECTKKIDKSRLPKSDVRSKLLSSALGLTTNQARVAFSRVWAKYERFDERSIEMVTWAKREIIKESGALEFWPAEEGEKNVGGLDLMKTWFTVRECAFSEQARIQNIPFPKGVVLIGIPGTGKSLSAKLLSGMWKLPLLRLDMGAIFGSLLGESEKHMNRAIMLAETVSPCILWIDEMEKAFAGAGPGSINAGAPTRVFGSFLTWMQEHKTPVYVFATANDVSSLPMELIGRFDRVFFLDMPNDIERHAIFKIHLERTGETFPERKFNFRELVEESKHFVGREIERAVREAQYTAFADGNREISQADLMKALGETVPLSKSHEEVIEKLQLWKKEGRAFPASSDEKVSAASQGRVVEIN